MSQLSLIYEGITECTVWNIGEMKSDYLRRIVEYSEEVLGRLEDCEMLENGDVATKKMIEAKIINLDENVADPRVERLIIDAIKCDERYFVDGYLELGEYYWKMGNVAASRKCFESVLARDQDNVSALKKYSIVIRYCSAEPKEKLENSLMGINFCKKCLELDMKDGEAWYYLGNAQLAYYFASGGAAGIQELRKCLIAYETAENNRHGSYLMDMNINRAEVLRYLGKYNDSLANLDKVLEYDPENDHVLKMKNDILKVVEDTSNKIKTKCSLEDNKITDYITPLININASSFTMLEPGKNTETVSCVIVGKIENSTQVPMMFIVSDMGESFMGLSIYNVALNVLNIGDVLILQECLLIDFENEEMDTQYQFLIVEGKDILKNGKALQRNQLSSTVADNK